MKCCFLIVVCKVRIRASLEQRFHDSVSPSVSKGWLLQRHSDVRADGLSVNVLYELPGPQQRLSAEVEALDNLVTAFGTTHGVEELCSIP